MMLDSIHSNVHFAYVIAPSKRKSVKNLRRPVTYEHDINDDDRLRAGVGAILGTAIPLAIMMKNRKIKNPLKMSYDLGDMVLLSASSIVGGVGAGMIKETKTSIKNKFKEGVFQFLNAAVPTWIVGGVLKLCETSEKYNNIPSKILSVIGGMLVGMYGCAEISNLIFDPQDKIPDRKLTLKDCIANADDAIGALALAKFPLMNKLHLEKALPVIYAYCGFRAGESN